jgi:hypothetical protein
MDYKKTVVSEPPWPEFDLTRPPPTFGAVLLAPEVWDIMEIDPDDYRKDRRSLHRLINGAWQSHRISVLHSGTIGPFGS